ncbi:restriction endonuclease subunit S [Pseudomonas aeruginosa]|uniref:restriction endonuclease subunit S n=1 Tax=Pseudomonas aeruginosa TaxID=287 RepID=UPI0022EBCB81|nr:restriction endonuclease subunit S [Pseudomonas aeruginosa]
MNSTLTPLEDVCISINSGGTPSRKQASYWDGGTIPWIKTGELNDWKVQSIGERITEEGLNNSSAKIYTPGTVLIAMYGDGKTITTMGLVDKPSATNQACCALVADPRICDPLYLFYALKDRRSALLNLVVAGAQRNLSVGTIRKFPILLHPLEAQRRIAGILGAYDGLIEVNRRRIAVLEEMARGLFTEWFTRLRFPGHEDVAIEDTTSGPLPAGWRIGSFTEVADVLSGGTPKKDRPEYWGGEVPFFTPRDASESAWALDTLTNVTSEGIANCNSKLYPKDTVFITARGTVGKVALAGRSMAMNQSCYALVGRGYPQFFVFSYTQFAAAHLQAMSNGAVFDTIIVDTFRKLQLPIPPAALAEKYSNTVGPIFEMSRVIAEATKRLASARDLLLPRLISGQLSVTQAEQELEVA